MNNEHQLENMGETKCTCDGSEEIWTKDGAWFVFWEVCHLHKTRWYSGSSNLFPLPEAREVNWESIADYTDLAPGAADHSLATMKAVLESFRLCRGTDRETVEKAAKAGNLAADNAQKNGADGVTVARAFADTVINCLSDKSNGNIVCKECDRPVDGDDNDFGVCPRCHKTDGYINIGRSHWFSCNKHKVCWCIGANLFSSWKDESEEDQRRIYDKLGFGSYEEVEPHHTHDKRQCNCEISNAAIKGRGTAGIDPDVRGT